MLYLKLCSWRLYRSYVCPLSSSPPLFLAGSEKYCLTGFFSSCGSVLGAVLSCICLFSPVFSLKGDNRVCRLCRLPEDTPAEGETSRLGRLVYAGTERYRKTLLGACALFSASFFLAFALPLSTSLSVWFRIDYLTFWSPPPPTHPPTRTHPPPSPHPLGLLSASQKNAHTHTHTDGFTRSALYGATRWRCFRTAAWRVQSRP